MPLQRTPTTLTRATDTDGRGQRSILQRIAHRAMHDRGLRSEISVQALAELDHIYGPASPTGHSTRDLRNLPWCSIDSDDSRDLDQLTVAEAMPDGGTRVRVAIADVDAIVKKRSALDEHARHNTTSVYTVAQTFPMFPDRLSTDLTSLNHGVDRLAIVIDMVLAQDGSLQLSDVYPATVNNRARLTSSGVADWLEGRAPMPQEMDAVGGLDEVIRLQDRVARRLNALRHLHGAFSVETIESRPVFDGDVLTGLQAGTPGRAANIIEDLMIAANSVTARFLATKGFPIVRRVVRTPRRWDRIIELAAARKSALPRDPDAKSLAQFLAAAKAADPLGFPHLSLSVIRLLGAGEYVVQLPGGTAAGPFGLAVEDYSHSTAPNRRYPDLITQRLLKAAMEGHAWPYDNDELVAFAAHCTEKEDAAKNVERHVAQSAAAMLLESRAGDRFDAFVTGESEKWTRVRLLHPPVEGRLESGSERLGVGVHLRVRLVRTDVERGCLDFTQVL